MSKDMAYYEKTFEWQQFPEGRARFVGGIRGWDERGHYVYAVELQGRVVYGEIAHAFLPNDNDYNIEVVSFGYGMEENVGISEPTSRGAYTRAELETVRSLIVQLIRAGQQFEEKPLLLMETRKSHFMGKIVFREGWTNLRQETVS